MIITFQSSAGADITMFGDVAMRMIKIIGKEPGERGVITVEQLPEAIARLKAAMDADKADRVGKSTEELPQFEKSGDGSMRPYVSLAQRSFPLVDLFERSLQRKVPVVWGF